MQKKNYCPNNELNYNQDELHQLYITKPFINGNSVVMNIRTIIF